MLRTKCCLKIAQTRQYLQELSISLWQILSPSTTMPIVDRKASNAIVIVFVWINYIAFPNRPKITQYCAPPGYYFICRRTGVFIAFTSKRGNIFAGCTLRTIVTKSKGMAIAPQIQN